MEKFITIVKHNYSWNQIRKIRRDIRKLNEIYYHPKCNDKTKRIIDFYKRNSKPFDSHKK
ncbi:MAG: hypothetical protein IPL26_13740 [Leptospiraceae bacterium]|nr:hypothetical protein [Leptospiraceae bacterium]